MRIEWTEPALEDLAAIRDYIGKDSRYYARRYVSRIFEAAAKLKDFPAMGRHVPEAGARTDVRELIFEHYRIIYLYLVEPQRLQILTVIHGSRDLQGQAQKPWGEK
jgi:plasmid stabilization system protein ParE